MTKKGAVSSYDEMVRSAPHLWTMHGDGSGRVTSMSQRRTAPTFSEVVESFLISSMRHEQDEKGQWYPVYWSNTRAVATEKAERLWSLWGLPTSHHKEAAA